jgi:hypothetical protein
MTLPRSDEADANTRFSKRPILCTTLAIWIQVSVLAAGHNFEDMVRSRGESSQGEMKIPCFFCPPHSNLQNLIDFFGPAALPHTTMLSTAHLNI